MTNKSDAKIININNDFGYSKPLKPFIKWVGGKSQLLYKLQKLLPSANDNTYKKYCEPMVGGGALLFYVLNNCNFEQFYISDINCELINTYKVIKSNVFTLIHKLRELQSAFCELNKLEKKDFYYQIRDKFNSTELNFSTVEEKAAYFIFLNKTCFNGLFRVNKNRQFNVPMGDYEKPVILDEENLLNIHYALQKVNIVCGDYSLSKSFIDNSTFVYIDPPYRPISETSDFTSYNSVEFDDNEQLRLARFVNEINDSGAKLVLSNSDPKNTNRDDNFFEKLYSRYNIQRVLASRMINSISDNRGILYELLIYNKEKIMKRNFDEWLKTFKTSICDYNYYTDFKKVFANVDEIKVELNILNSLIGCKDIETAFEKLLADYPQVLKCIPILLAVRSYQIYAIDGDGEFLFNFKNPNYTVKDYVTFMQKTGLFDLISNHIINNLVDYVTGIEVGLDSNGRKNRGGHLMENLVEDYLIKAGLIKGKTYFKEMLLSTISQLWDIDLSGISNNGKADKRLDFVVKKGNTIYGIETNFYSSGGSKLNETARSYKNIALEAKNIEGFAFVWITDGYDGWKTARHNLEETFDVLDNMYCIADLENGIMNTLFD